MNDQYFGKEYNPSDIVEGTYKDTTSAGVNSDVFADKVPGDATHIHETPMGGTEAAVGPMNGPLADETPIYETPVEVIERGGNVAAVGLMDATIVHEAPMDETIPYTALVVETIPLPGSVERDNPLPGSGGRDNFTRSPYRHECHATGDSAQP